MSPLTRSHPPDSSLTRPAKCFDDPTLSNRAFAIFFIVAILIAIALLLAPKAGAAPFTWAPPATGNAKWSTTSNWSGGVAPPLSGADLFFGGTNKLTPLMDSNYSILSLTFNSGAGAFNLTSNGGTEILTIGIGGITNSSTNTQTITSSLILSGAQTWNAASGGLTINSATVNLGANSLTISGANNTSITGTISGVGGSITKNGAGTLTLSGANTYSGGTFFGNAGGSAAGTLALGSSSVGGPGAVTSGPLGTGTLNLRGNGASSTIRSTDATARTIDNAIVFSGTNIDIHYGTNTTGNLNFGGTVDLGGAGATRTFTVDNTNTTFSGVISGSGNTLAKAGTGTLILSGANTYGAVNVIGTTVSAGTLLVNNTTGSGTGVGGVGVNGSGTTLGGTGTISGSVFLGNNTPGAILNPGPMGTAGTAAAVGTLNTGALTLIGSNVFHIDASGTLATNWDNLSVTGAVNLGTTSTLQLSIASGLTFVNGTQYILISNDLTDLISGFFSNAANGSTIVANGYRFTVNYNGGTNGNDLVLTSVVPEPSTWMGAALALAAVGYMQRRRFTRLVRRAA